MSEDQPEDPLLPGEPKVGNANSEDNDFLFASVWVKVEVNDEDEIQNENEPLAHTVTEKIAIQKRARPKQSYKKRPQKPKNLKCTLCDYKCAQKTCLETHMLGHSKVKPYTCTHCDYKTRYPLSLKRHIFVQHECKESDSARLNLPTYNCSICKYTTNFKWNLSSHQRKHDLAKQFQCMYCNYSTAYKHNHIKHSRRHTMEKVSTYCCDKCPFTSKFEGHIVRHLAKVHFEVSEKASRCDNCSFSTRTKWRLNLHINRSRQDKLIKCSNCEFETNFRCALREHKLTHTGNTLSNQKWLENLFSTEPNREIQNVKENKDQSIAKMYEMPSKELANESILESSQIFHELRSKFMDESYYTYNENPLNVETNFNQQTEHERNNHYLLDPTCEVEWGSIRVIESPDQDRPFQCITCTYKAKFKASVQRHYQRHHTSHNRPYKCVKCDFCTKTKDQIVLHNKRSKSEEVLNCKSCPFNTVFKCQFAMHEKAHFPFKCVYCDYACKKKHDIQRHFTVVHLGNGLKCSYCDFRATRKESLLVHEAIHTGKKPFECQHCPYTSVRRHLLENHILRFHKTKESETILDESKIESLRKPIIPEAEGVRFYVRESPHVSIN